MLQEIGNYCRPKHNSTRDVFYRKRKKEEVA